MLVNLYGFMKKKNSTARPSIQDATTFTNVQLKESTSVLNPILIFNPGSSGMPSPTFTPNAFTYAHIPNFERYYFVQDWRWINGLWECSLTVDVLASYKTAIGLTNEYVTRCSYAFTTEISDKLYPVTTDYAVTRTIIDLGLNSTGFYVVGLISNSSAVSEGAVSYYIMSAAEMANFKSYLMSETFLSANGLSNLQEINKELVKVLYNPFQYIVSCKFFPYDYPSNTGTAVSSINFGWWSIPMSARLISGYVTFIKQSATFTALAHPQASRGRYLNHAPYTDIYLMHPLIGTIVLDSNKIEATNTVVITIETDAISGQGCITITNTTRGIRLYEAMINMAQDIPLAQINTDVLGVARTAVDSVGSIATGAVSGLLSGNLLGAIASPISGILNTIESTIPILQSSGQNGNKANYYAPANFYTVQRKVADEDNANRGRPYCKKVQLSNVPGFILCADAHAEISCFASERDEIINYMTTGFYYE